MGNALNASSGSEAETLIVCAKCHHPNPAEAERCVNCQKHLYVFCHECGFKNPRGNGRCDQCRTPLHHFFAAPPPSHKLYWPYCWRFDPARKWMIPAQILCLAAAGILVATLSVNATTFLNDIERFLFPDLFNEFPTIIPRRYSYPMHAFMVLLGMLLIGLGVKFLAWLGRQSMTPTRDKSERVNI